MIPCLCLFLQVTLKLFTECFYVVWTKWIWFWNFSCVPQIHLASSSLRGMNYYRCVFTGLCCHGGFSLSFASHRCDEVWLLKANLLQTYIISFACGQNILDS